MHICLVSQEYPPETARGGIGTQTWNKARTLASLGHEVDVLSSATEPGPPLVSRHEDGINVHRLQPPGFAFPVYEPATFSVGYSWAVLGAFNRLHEGKHFDLVNFPEYGGEGFAYQVDRTPWSWVPTVVHLHGPLAMFTERIGWPEVDSEHHHVGTFLEGTSIRLADRLIASSANIADFAANYYGVDRDLIDVVHCGIDVDQFTPRDDGDRPTPPTVLFVGNIAENKGVMTVFEAVLRLRSRYPDLRFRIAGKGDDDLATDLLRRARDAGAADLVELVGFVADRDRLPELYRSATLFASPARHEVGVANVYVEAMACGCPVVASVTGGAPEAVTHGESGLLVRPGDVEQTAAAFERILGDPGLRQSLSRGARRRVDDYFATEHYIKRVLDGFERAMERSRERLSELTGQPVRGAR